MDNQIINAEPRVPSEYVQNVGTMLSLAIEKGIDADSLGKLVALQNECLDRQAKDEFFAAMAQFHAECPIIGKNRTAKIRSKKGEESNYSYGYADLAMVAETIRPFCEKHGFSYSFRQKFDKGFVETICIVRHAAGHHEETGFTGPSDNDSGMSAMQKAIAATTSARRLALVLAFGLSVGEDNDGRGSLPPEHENPERDHSAPKNQPRDRREKPITRDDVAVIYKAWSDLHPPRASSTKESLVAEFTEWCVQATGVEFAATKPEAWTRSLLQQAMNAAKEEQEVRQA